jgi:hypothetical protein
LTKEMLHVLFIKVINGPLVMFYFRRDNMNTSEKQTETHRRYFCEHGIRIRESCSWREGRQRKQNYQRYQLPLPSVLLQTTSVRNFALCSSDLWRVYCLMALGTFVLLLFTEFR